LAFEIILFALNIKEDDTPQSLEEFFSNYFLKTEFTFFLIRLLLRKNFLKLLLLF
jgi:hypothetical protein